MKNQKSHERYENFECCTDEHYIGAVIKILLTLGCISECTCLLCKSTSKSTPKSPEHAGWAKIAVATHFCYMEMTESLQ